MKNKLVFNKSCRTWIRSAIARQKEKPQIGGATATVATHGRSTIFDSVSRLKSFQTVWPVLNSWERNVPNMILGAKITHGLLRCQEGMISCKTLNKGKSRPI
jgi:hypothetical protein